MDLIKEPNRVYALDGEGGLLAEVTFPDEGVDAVLVNHTYVDERLRGQGVAGRLMEAAVEVARARGKRIIPSCSYAVAWFQKHAK